MLDYDKNEEKKWLDQDMMVDNQDPGILRNLIHQQAASSNSCL
jgi:hypothetical protein